MSKLILFLMFAFSLFSYARSEIIRVESISTDIIGIERINEEINEVTNPPKEECHNCRTSNDFNDYALLTEHRKDGVFFNEKCTSFIDTRGINGEWGDIIFDYIDEKGGANSLFLDDEVRGMTAQPRTCPNWYNLNTAQRKKFWVWMMASIAQVESSCGTDQVNTGIVPNSADRPRGLFQLNTLKKNRQWRGDNCKFPSGAKDTNIPRNQIRCSMDIMHELLKGKRGEYKSSGRIFPTNSYWEKLRPEHSSTGGPIGELIRKFPPCDRSYN